MVDATLGPHVVNQVFTVVTGWGFAARCGCGWRSPHDTQTGARAAGEQHLHVEHGPEQRTADEMWVLFDVS